MAHDENKDQTETRAQIANDLRQRAKAVHRGDADPLVGRLFNALTAGAGSRGLAMEALTGIAYSVEQGSQSLPELDELRARIAKARAIHEPEQHSDEFYPWCTYCNRDDNTRDDVVLWPCPTVRALDGRS